MIEVKDLEFHRKNFSLKKLNFTVEAGMIVGLIGRNGSGKTTTIGCLTDLLPVSGGEYRVFGKKMWELTEDEKQQIGIVDMTLNAFKVTGNFFKLCKRLEGIYKNFDRELFLYHADKFQLPASHKRISTYSMGEYEKLLFAIALSHNTKLLFVDESTAVLDPIARDEIFDSLREFVEAGNSVFITSHILSDLEKICDKVLVIDNGEIFLETSVDELKENYAVIECKEEDLENIDSAAILSKKQGRYATSLLVRRKMVNETYLNKPSSLDEIIIRLLRERTPNRFADWSEQTQTSEEENDDLL